MPNKKNTTQIIALMSTLMVSISCHADVYFKNDFETNITDCQNTLVNLEQQTQPSNYFVQSGQTFGEALNFSGFAIKQNQYASLFFIAPEQQSGNNRGRLNLLPPSNGQGQSSAGTTIAISECRGDFSTHLNQSTCQRVGGGSPSLRWALDTVAGNPLTDCLLIPGQVYYLNIIHSNSIDTIFQQSTCSFANCGVLFTHTEDN